MTTDVHSDAENAERGRTQSFEADVSRLLHLMVHSVYSDRDIFVRELVSNAADACEKLRYEALARPELIEEGGPFAITIAIDPDAKTLTFADNGVGMGREELVEALGTIASSGTRAFLEKLGAEDKAKEGAANLIGQFGIGFYSAFMVADEVVVETRRAGTPKRGRWSSDGKGAYTIAPLAIESRAPPRRARRPASQCQASSEYAEPHRLERIVREHSGAVAVPIDSSRSPARSRAASPTARRSGPSRSRISRRRDYTEFYRGLSGQYDEPALTRPLARRRASRIYGARLRSGIAAVRPVRSARKGRAKLYVRRVLISQDADLLPGWLRFVRLVVDSADMPLNVSREMIQESAVFAAIRKGVANRIVQELTKLAESEPEKFAKVWENFGAVLKEGLYEDPERRDALFKLARFATSSHPDGGRTLADYVGALKENQTAIYYLTGDDAKRLAASPQLEGFRARGVEVLLLADPVDAFWVSTAAGYRGQAVQIGEPGGRRHQGDRARRRRRSRRPRAGAKSATLFAYFKQKLGERDRGRARLRSLDGKRRLPGRARFRARPPARKDARLAWPRQRADQADPRDQPSHPLTASLAKTFSERSDKAMIDDAAFLLLDEARLMEGGSLADAFGLRCAAPSRDGEGAGVRDGERRRAAVIPTSATPHSLLRQPRLAQRVEPRLRGRGLRAINNLTLSLGLRRRAFGQRGLRLVHVAFGRVRGGQIEVRPNYLNIRRRSPCLLSPITVSKCPRPSSASAMKLCHWPILRIRAKLQAHGLLHVGFCLFELTQIRLDVTAKREWSVA